MAKAGKPKHVKSSLLHANSWSQLISFVKNAEAELQTSEILWFRGTVDAGYPLMPTLMRYTCRQSRTDHDALEQELFFEFQARTPDLRLRNLSDWDYLFYGRHYGVPTRLLDWTDTLGVAVYFALEKVISDADERKAKTEEVDTGRGEPTPSPTIWMLNPYALNRKTWLEDEIILPRYLGLQRNGEEWDFGELLAATGDWAWDGPVAIYPIQLSERVRAQRAWFTIHGNDRSALEDQFPKLVTKITLGKACVDEGLEFLEWSGFNRFSIYPDYDNLATWLKQKNRPTTKSKATRKSKS
jgi:hypothetical protein